MQDIIIVYNFVFRQRNQSQPASGKEITVKVD